MSNFGTIITEVRNASGRDSGDAAEVVSVKFNINLAQRTLAVLNRWNCLKRKTSFTTTNGTSEYTISSVDRILNMWHEEYGYPHEICAITEDAYLEFQYDTSATGKPTYYYIVNQQQSSQLNQFVIRLFPVPDSSSYTVYYTYYTAITDMSADSDTPTFPPQFDYLIILMATYMGRKFNEKENLAVLDREDVKLALSALRKWDATNTAVETNMLKRRRKVRYETNFVEPIVP